MYIQLCKRSHLKMYILSAKNPHTLYKDKWVRVKNTERKMNSDAHTERVQPSESFLLIAACLIRCSDRISHLSEQMERKRQTESLDSDPGLVKEQKSWTQAFVSGGSKAWRTCRLSSHSERETKALRFHSDTLWFDFSCCRTCQTLQCYWREQYIAENTLP